MPSLVLLMLSDCSLNPIGKVCEAINCFKVDHGSLKSDWESSEELGADHCFINVVIAHSDHMIKVGNIFIEVSSFHFEGIYVASCFVLTHKILECQGKVIDNGGPNPFVSVCSSCRKMMCNDVIGVLDPCCHSGSANISQEQIGSVIGGPHDEGVPFKAMIKVPRGEKLFYLILISIEYFWFVTHQFIGDSFNWRVNWLGRSPPPLSLPLLPDGSPDRSGFLPLSDLLREWPPLPVPL